MKKGFTLLELLIVIGILAILSTTMLLVINPAEMLRKARDSQRISDLNTLKSAISLYLADVKIPNIGDASYSYEYSYGITLNTKKSPILSLIDKMENLLIGDACYSTTISLTGCLSRITTSTQSLKVDGTGWIPVNFTSINGGSPISNLPIDPNPVVGSDISNRFYVYLPFDDLTFELAANMESNYFSKGGAGSVEDKDGGFTDTIYEVGTKLATDSLATIGCFGTSP